MVLYIELLPLRLNIYLYFYIPLLLQFYIPIVYRSYSFIEYRAALLRKIRIFFSTV